MEEQIVKMDQNEDGSFNIITQTKDGKRWLYVNCYFSKPPSVKEQFGKIKKRAKEAIAVGDALIDLGFEVKPVPKKQHKSVYDLSQMKHKKDKSGCLGDPYDLSTIDRRKK